MDNELNDLLNQLITKVDNLTSILSDDSFLAKQKVNITLPNDMREVIARVKWSHEGGMKRVPLELSDAEKKEKMNGLSDKINELIEEFNALSGNMCIMPLCYSSR